MIQETSPRKDTVSVLRPDLLSYKPIHTLETLLPPNTLHKVAIPRRPNTIEIETAWIHGRFDRTNRVTFIHPNLHGVDYAWIMLPQTENITPVTISRVGKDKQRTIISEHLIVRTLNPTWKTLQEDILLPFFSELTQHQDMFPSLFQTVTTEKGNLIILSEPDADGFFIIGGKSKRPEMVSIGTMSDDAMPSTTSTISDAYTGVWGLKIAGGKNLQTIAVSLTNESTPITLTPTVINK